MSCSTTATSAELHAASTVPAPIDSANAVDSVRCATSTAATPTATATLATDWTCQQCIEWAQRKHHLSDEVVRCIAGEDLDGRCLLALSECDIRDLRDKYGYTLRISDIKRFWMAVRSVQRENHVGMCDLGLEGTTAGPAAGAASLSTSTSLSSGISSSSTLCPNSAQLPSVMACGDAHQSATLSAAASSALSQNYGICVSQLMFHQQQLQQQQQQQQQQHFHHMQHHHHHHHVGGGGVGGSGHDLERISPPLSVDGRATSIQPEFFKTFISLGYAFLVTWITAIVMVIVHERVPDMKRYPPLPDIFLDNVPHIPWAFSMCEITGTVLFVIWASVLLVHKHRFVLLRRFFALGGTVFLLRCVTMLITSLSVPGTHLQCNPNDFKLDDSTLTPMESVLLRINRAYSIWSGMGMSIRGVRSCGDYMFSGHTVALTTLNFFITEYTPRHLYFLHTMTWLLNMFGIFFILAAHEHYSIDVFVAFYITSRLFLYYHTLANNQALMSHDSNRTRIWFPMFSYFESSVDGIIPNEYDSLEDVFNSIFSWIICAKDCCMLTARRFWIDAHSQLPPMPKTSQLSLFGRSLNDLVLSASPIKRLSSGESAADAPADESDHADDDDDEACPTAAGDGSVQMDEALLSGASVRPASANLTKRLRGDVDAKLD